MSETKKTRTREPRIVSPYTTEHSLTISFALNGKGGLASHGVSLAMSGPTLISKFTLLNLLSAVSQGVLADLERDFVAEILLVESEKKNGG